MRRPNLMSPSALLRAREAPCHNPDRAAKEPELRSAMPPTLKAQTPPPKTTQRAPMLQSPQGSMKRHAGSITGPERTTPRTMAGRRVCFSKLEAARYATPTSRTTRNGLAVSVKPSSSQPSFAIECPYAWCCDGTHCASVGTTNVCTPEQRRHAQLERCDACDSAEPLKFSPQHWAHFCARCWWRINGTRFVPDDTRIARE